eukprot:424403-Hanusia_phi.AAC.2
MSSYPGPISLYPGSNQQEAREWRRRRRGEEGREIRGGNLRGEEEDLLLDEFELTWHEKKNDEEEDIRIEEIVGVKYRRGRGGREREEREEEREEEGEEKREGEGEGEGEEGEMGGRDGRERRRREEEWRRERERERERERRERLEGEEEEEEEEEGESKFSCSPPRAPHLGNLHPTWKLVGSHAEETR